MVKIRMRKITRKALILAAILITASTILLTVSVQSRNLNQSTYPLVNAYLQGVSQSPKNPITEKSITPTYIWYNYNFSSNWNNDSSIIVNNSNIVINGNGFSVEGPDDGTGYGFNLASVSNVTIFDVTVTEWQYGFYLSNCSNCNITCNTATNNGYDGFYTDSINNCNISSNIAINNYYGFYLDSSDNNNVSNNNVVSGYGYCGFYLDSCNGNTLSGDSVTNYNYGFYLDSSSSNNNLLGNTVLNSIFGYFWVSSSINNDFTGSTWFSFLQVNTTDSSGAPLSGVEVEVVTNGTTIVYATPYFGGTDSTTDQNGLTGWIIVQYGVFTGNDTMTYNSTTATVYYNGYTFTNNPRTLNMSTSYVETFSASAQPTPTPSPPTDYTTALFLVMAQQQQPGALLTYVTAGLGFASVVLAFAVLNMVLGRGKKF
jgi:parallel beta-helix repeat protein